MSVFVSTGCVRLSTSFLKTKSQCGTILSFSVSHWCYLTLYQLSKRGDATSEHQPKATALMLTPANRDAWYMKHPQLLLHCILQDTRGHNNRIVMWQESNNSSAVCSCWAGASCWGQSWWAVRGQTETWTGWSSQSSCGLHRGWVQGAEAWLRRCNQSPGYWVSPPSWKRPWVLLLCPKHRFWLQPQCSREKHYFFWPCFSPSPALLNARSWRRAGLCIPSQGCSPAGKSPAWGARTEPSHWAWWQCLRKGRGGYQEINSQPQTRQNNGKSWKPKLPF